MDILVRETEIKKYNKYYKCIILGINLAGKLVDHGICKGSDLLISKLEYLCKYWKCNTFNGFKISTVKESATNMTINWNNENFISVSVFRIMENRIKNNENLNHNK